MFCVLFSADDNQTVLYGSETIIYMKIVRNFIKLFQVLINNNTFLFNGRQIFNKPYY